MILSDIETAVRQDLFDPAGANQRWATSDIDRAIDKAVDRYSQYYPNVVYTDMDAQPFQRTYPYPQPWNAPQPVALHHSFCTSATRPLYYYRWGDGKYSRSTGDYDTDIAYSWHPALL